MKLSWVFKISKDSGFVLDEMGNSIDYYYPFIFDFDDLDMSDGGNIDFDYDKYWLKHTNSARKFVASMFDIDVAYVISLSEADMLKLAELESQYNDEEVNSSINSVGLFRCPDCGAVLGMNNLASFSEPAMNKRSGVHSTWIHFD